MAESSHAENNFPNLDREVSGVSPYSQKVAREEQVKWGEISGFSACCSWQVWGCVCLLSNHKNGSVQIIRHFNTELLWLEKHPLQNWITATA